MLKDYRDFEKELTSLINRHSIDNDLNTPDFILSDMIVGILLQTKSTLEQRDTWFGFEPFKDLKTHILSDDSK